MTIEIPEQLRNRRIRFIKLHNETKLPIELGWQLCEEDWERQKDNSWKNKQDGRIHKVKTKTYTDEKHNYTYNDVKFQIYLSKGNSYGALCGKGSDGLIVIDADKPELAKYIKDNLPNTFREHNDAHIYYWCPELTNEISLNKNKIHYGEIKSTGRQVKVYPDNNNIAIATITKKELLDKLKEFVAWQDGTIDFERNVDSRPKSTLLFKDSIPCQAVQNMINKGAPTDYRNPTANKIVQQLRGYCGYSKARCLECLKIFNNNCKLSKVDSVIEKDLDKQYDDYGYVSMNCNTYADYCPFKDDISKCPKSKTIMEKTNKHSKIIEDLPISDKKEKPKTKPVINVIDFFEINKKGKPGRFLAKKMGDFIKERMTFKTITGNDKQIYYYKDGYYHKNGLAIIKKYATRYTGSLFKNYYVGEVEAYIRNTTYVDADDINNDWVNLKNGLYNPLLKEFKDHTPEIFSLIQLPISYDKDAECSLWEKELKKKCDEDWKYDLIQEIFGYSFLPDNRFEKAFLLYGDNQTMKSTTLFMLIQLVGEENICALSLQQLTEDKHAPADLYGRPVNVCADLSSRELRYDAIFLKVIGRDPITAGKKFEQQITFIPITMLVYSCNTIPGTTNKNLAFYRRWCLIEFNIKHTKKDIKMREKLCEELPGIFNWAIKGLDRILENNKLSYPLSDEQTRDLYEKNSNSIQSFIFNEIDCENDESVLKKRETYNRYKVFCKENKLTPDNQIKFGRIFYAITGCGTKRVGTIPAYSGVSFIGKTKNKDLNEYSGTKTDKDTGGI